MKAKFDKVFKFLTPNVIPGESKRLMDMQKACIWRPGRRLRSFRTQFFRVVPADILAKLHPITWGCILGWVFSCRFLQTFESTLFRKFLYDGFYRFAWERFHVSYSRFFWELYPCVRGWQSGACKEWFTFAFTFTFAISIWNNPWLFLYIHIYLFAIIIRVFFSK